MENQPEVGHPTHLAIAAILCFPHTGDGSILAECSSLTGSGPHTKNPLCLSQIRAHRPEIMLGVLVVALCRDRVAELGFGMGERQIPLIASLRVLRALRFGSGGTRSPPLGACSRRRRRSGAFIHQS